MHLSTARYQEIERLYAEGVEPIRSQVTAAMDRFWTPLIAAETYTGTWPHKLRFERPANDIEAAVQHFACTYTMAQVARPVLIEYYEPPPADPLSFMLKPRPVPSPEARRASVSVRHAWRVVKRVIMRRA